MQGIESRKVSNRRRREKHDVTLTPLRGGSIKELEINDIPLIFLTRNSKIFINSFLRHYRNMGITRFICVDDNSSDGTKEALLNESDVDIFFSNVRYRDARRGRIWREILLSLYGENRWYLNIDVDEYFIYEDYENKNLRDFITALENAGIMRCPAPMIDCYPAGDIRSAHFDGSTNAMPWEVAPLYDGSGYELGKTKRALTLRGGPRARMLDSDAELMKYPLIFWKKGHSLGASIHQPTPFRHNFSPIHGALLHFKFFNNTIEKAKDAVEDGQYFNGSIEYKKISDYTINNNILIMNSDVSIKYINSKDMIKRGFMNNLFSSKL